MKIQQRSRVYKQLKSRWLALLQREDGANLVLMALVIPVLLGFAGLAVDGSNLYYQSQRVQISADAAALGGARKLAASADYAEVNDEIRQLAFANDADAVSWDYINIDDSGKARGVHVVTSRNVPAYFARIYGHSVFTVTAEAEAQYEPVTGVDGLFPLTLDCDCVNDEDIIPVGDGGGSGDDSSPTATPTSTPSNDTAPISGTVEFVDSQSSSYVISYMGQTGNTWVYEVSEVDGLDLSHWLLNIESCLDQVVSFTPSGAALGTDGSTGVSGIKWDVDSAFTSGTFSFTLDENYPSGEVDALAKAGTEFGTVAIRGPICDGTNSSDGGDSGSSGVASLCLPTLDFETDTAGAALVAGQIIDTEWAAWGMRVTTNSPSSHPAMIFNTANPTGDDDDLGTANQAYGGPGMGVGGGSSMPGSNSAPLGKVLIVAENTNATNPDDSANGGTLIFTFDYAVRIDDVRILDIDDAGATGTIKAYRDTSGTTLAATGKMLGLGDNSVQTVGVNALGVRRLEINFPESGSVASIVSCRNGLQPTYSIGNLLWSDTNSNNLQDSGEAGISGVALELYVSGQNYVVANATTNVGGEYLFSSLPAGSYEIKLATANFDTGGPLAGATYSTANSGSNDSLDSDFNSSTGRAAVIIENASNFTVDGGFRLATTTSPDPGSQSVTIKITDNKNSQYEVSLVGTVGNTWTYRVREISGRDLSHWDLGIVNCLDKIVSHSPTTGFASGIDGSTGFNGIKWDVAGSFSDATFSFTLNGSYQARPRQALVKAGNGNAQLPISGPDCSVPATTSTPTPTPTATPTQGGGSDDPGEVEACAFSWLDWNGVASSNIELADYMYDTDLSGVWRLGEVIPAGPGVSYSSSSSEVDSELEDLAESGATVKIPLTNWTGSGYAICGFANVRLLNYHLEEGNSWLNLQFLQTLIHGAVTDPNATDYGARDVRFER